MLTVAHVFGIVHSLTGTVYTGAMSCIADHDWFHMADGRVSITELHKTVTKSDILKNVDNTQFRNDCVPIAVIPGTMSGNGRHFGRFISIATTALTVSIAYLRQHRRVMGAMLERQAPVKCERPHMRDFWEVMVHNFRHELWRWGFSKLTCFCWTYFFYLQFQFGQSQG